MKGVVKVIGKRAALRTRGLNRSWEVFSDGTAMGSDSAEKPSKLVIEFRKLCWCKKIESKLWKERAMQCSVHW